MEDIIVRVFDNGMKIENLIFRNSSLNWKFVDVVIWELLPVCAVVFSIVGFFYLLHRSKSNEGNNIGIIIISSLNIIVILLSTATILCLLFMYLLCCK